MEGVVRHPSGCQAAAAGTFKGTHLGSRRYATWLVLGVQNPGWRERSRALHLALSAITLTLASCQVYVLNPYIQEL